MNSYTEVPIAEAVQCFEEIKNSNPNSSQRISIEGTLWILKNRAELVSSKIFSTNNQWSSLQNQLLSANHDDSTGELSPNTVPEPFSYCGYSGVSTEDSFSVSHCCLQIFETPSSPVSITVELVEKQQKNERSSQTWTPSPFLRTRICERRHSSDAAECKAHFNKRCYQLRHRLRRRKTMSEESLKLAAAQGHQLLLLRDSTAHHSNPNSTLTLSVASLTYRRSRSAVTMADISIFSESRGVASARVIRKHSLSCENGESIEVWPETITALLTGGQLLIDRTLLLIHLAERLDREANERIDNFYANESRLYQAEYLNSNLKKAHELGLLCGGVSIARPDKKWGGEDAFFIHDTNESKFFGVADGVGEWGELGCNPRKFAEELMEGAKQEASKLKPVHDHSSVHQDRASIIAQKVLAAGFRNAKAFGSSTALVAGLGAESKTLGVANIGDSTCLVLRRESQRHRHFVAFRRTKEQQHFFNCPYQLSRVPNREDLPKLASLGMHGLVRALSSLSSRLESDTPEMADLYDIKVQEGDLIIVATDGIFMVAVNLSSLLIGVFDNLFDQEIANLVSLAISPHEASALIELLSPRSSKLIPHPNSLIPPQHDEIFGFATPAQDIAQAISEAAFYRSLDPSARTPFARQSKRAGRFFAGGKMDDITTVVAWVV